MGEKRLPSLSGVLIVSALVGLASWGAVALTRDSGGIAAIWPANGLLLVVLLALPRSEWPAYLIGGYLANVGADLLMGDALSTALALSSCNTVEVTLASLALRWFAPGPFDLRQRRTLLGFLLFGVGVAPLVAVLLALLWLSLLTPGPFSPAVVGGWYAADALGMATVAPGVWALRHGHLRELPSGRRLAELIAVLGLLGLVSAVTFSSGSFLLLFLVFPILLMVVFRFGLAGAAVGAFLVAGIAIGMTVTRHGPIAFAPGVTPAHRILIVQLYVAATLVMTLPFAALLERRKELEQAVRGSESLYRLLFEQAGDAVMLFPLSGTGVAGTFVKVNDLACRHLGYTREELLRLTPRDIQAPENGGVFREVFAGRTAAGPIHVERVHLAKDGRRIPVEISGHRIEVEGRSHGLVIVRDVTERRQAEESLRRANRALRMVSSCNQVLARAASEAELLQDICRVCVEDYGFKLAWVGYAELSEGRPIRAVARAGCEEGYLEALQLTWADIPRGQCPAGVAIRTGRAAVCHDFLTDPTVALWREDAVRRGYRASTALPLKGVGRTFGVLCVYSGDQNAFDADEVALLSELADDLAQGIQVQRTRLAHRLAERSLATSDELLRQFIKHTPAAVAMLDTQMCYVQASDRWLTDYHLEGQSVVGRSHYEVFPDIPDRWKEVHRRVLAGAVERCEEDPFERADGSTEWLQWECRPWHRADGTIGGLIMFTQVITERIRSEQALRESNAKLLLAMDVARLGYWEYDVTAARFLFDDNFFKLYRTTAAREGGALMSAEEYTRRFVPPEEVAAFGREIERAVTSTDPHFTRQLEHRIVRADGSPGFLLARFTTVRNPQGRTLRIYGVSQDITDRRTAEAALEQQRQRANAIIDSAMDGIITVDEQHCVVLFNPAAERMFGCSAAEALGEPIDRFIPERRSARRHYLRDLEPPGTSARASGALGPVAGIRADGEEFPIEALVSQTEVDGHRLFTVTCRDVTERQRAERALRESEERFRQLAENIREIYWLTDVATDRLLYVSPSAERIWGEPAERLLETPWLWLEAVHPDDRERIREAQLTKPVRGDYDEEYRLIHRDGSVHWVHDRAFPIRDASGRVYRIAGVTEDVTARKAMEEQFRQAQKMEAIGQLAGGVAHDFNNILAAIMMQVGLASDEPGLPPPAREFLNDIRTSAERAASLTRQLLLFSRQQVLQTGQLDLNQVVTGLAKLLQRFLREDIRLQLSLHPSPLPVQADASMLDQVLLNLAVNARDAMPAGGLLAIETRQTVLTDEDARLLADASPGQYACLRVTDTGTGIAPEHLPHVFEPFFTTKEAGKGTGLGLATVFGIVKQHHGVVRVSSQVGRGTTFEIMLPRSAAASDAASAPPAAGRRIRGTETILLVEDDADVRAATQRVLEQQGYAVVAAANGVEGLRLAERGGERMRLLLTDMVMPEGISGYDLASRLQTHQPALKVIFMSGYNAEMAGGELRLCDGQTFLQKPFGAADLLDAVRRSLDE
jgi:PAS domain S-box-containing protein